MKNQLSNFGGFTEDEIVKLDKSFKDDDNDQTINGQIFIFLHQCMSFYFGDSDWYSDKSDKKSNKKIISIEHPKDGGGNIDKDKIQVTFKDNSDRKYTNVKSIALEKVAAPAPK
jgi:hypothetical protein